MILEEHLSTEVADSYEVAVCGGGVAGIAAALAAARCGKKTALFERQFMLGGLGTSGLVTIYLPLCDGYGHQVSFGIAEELLRLSMTHEAEARNPVNWLTEGGSRTENDPRYQVQYNPQLFAILTERLLREAGVTVFYGAQVAGVQKRQDKIEYIILESKSGRTAYQVGAVVDATGDCDVAYMAGAPTRLHKRGNKLAAWYYSLGEAGYNLNMLGCADIAEEEKVGTVEEKPLSEMRFGGLELGEISRFMCASHDSTYADFLKKREQDASLIPITIATIPQFRMTRRLVGAYELAESEMHTRFEDSVGMIADWTKRGPVYEVPFRTLYSEQVKNLICAGRCTSVTDPMWNLMRVIPCCSVTGQAAGTAAAMTDDFGSMDVKALQAELERGGVVLHESSVL